MVLSLLPHGLMLMLMLMYDDDEVYDLFFIFGFVAGRLKKIRCHRHHRRERSFILFLRTVQ